MGAEAQLGGDAAECMGGQRHAKEQLCGFLSSLPGIKLLGEKFIPD